MPKHVDNKHDTLTSLQECLVTLHNQDDTDAHDDDDDDEEEEDDDDDPKSCFKIA